MVCTQMKLAARRMMVSVFMLFEIVSVVEFCRPSDGTPEFGNGSGCFVPGLIDPGVIEFLIYSECVLLVRMAIPVAYPIPVLRKRVERQDDHSPERRDIVKHFVFVT